MKKIIQRIKAKISSMSLSAQERRHALVGPHQLWKMKQDFQIKFVKDQGLKPQHKFIDIGCGTLRGGIPIIKHLDVGNYYGIDVRENVLKEGKKGLREEKIDNKKPTLIHFDDFAALNIDARFDMMFAFSVMIHLSDDIADKCLGFVSRHLSDSGVYYANVNIGKRPEGSWFGFPVVFRSLEFYKGLAEKHGLSIKSIGTLGELGHVSERELQDIQVMFEFRKI